MQKYLECRELSIKQKKLIFKARTGMLPVGFNYGKKIPCPLCQMNDDTDLHLIKCPITKFYCPDTLAYDCLIWQLRASNIPFGIIVGQLVKKSAI